MLINPIPLDHLIRGASLTVGLERGGRGRFQQLEERLTVFLPGPVIRGGAYPESV